MFPRPVGLLFDFSLRRLQNAFTLGARSPFGFVDDFSPPLLRLGYDIRRLRFRFVQHVLRPLFGKLLLVLSAFRRGQAIRYLLFASLQSTHDRGPDVLHRKPDEDHKGEQLTDKSQIYVHPGITSRWTR